MKLLAIAPTTQSEIRDFLKLALPLASAQVAQALTGFVDTLMMGRLGRDALAAGGLAVMVFMAILMTGIGIVSSVSPLAAQAYGAQSPEQVGQVTRQGLWLALLIALPVVPIIGNLGQMMRSLGQASEVVALADAYLSIICWGLLPALGFAVLRCTITALGRTRPIFVIMVVANLFNVLGNYVLAFGKLGFPAMGLSGLAIASALAHGVTVTSCRSQAVIVLGFPDWRGNDFRKWPIHCNDLYGGRDRHSRLSCSTVSAANSRGGLYAAVGHVLCRHSSGGSMVWSR